MKSSSSVRSFKKPLAQKFSVNFVPIFSFCPKKDKIPGVPVTVSHVKWKTPFSRVRATVFFRDIPYSVPHLFIVVYLGSTGASMLPLCNLSQPKPSSMASRSMPCALSIRVASKFTPEKIMLEMSSPRRRRGRLISRKRHMIDRPRVEADNFHKGP